jgi:DNA-binding transcriptional ArsR family regulator
MGRPWRRLEVAEERSGMPNRSKEVDIFEAHADFCRVFSDAKRIRILWFLGTKEWSVSEIAEHLDVTMQNASQHLRVMRDKGAVAHRKQGQKVLYRVANEKFLAGIRLVRRGLLEQLRSYGYAVNAVAEEEA